MNFLALDIGGANLKIADGLKFAVQWPFALWREQHRLALELRTLLSQAPPALHLAVTMTGELADCFANKTEGIQFILNAVAQAADNRHTRVYLCDGRMVTPQVALQSPLLVAAANWHALAKFAARYATTETALLIDIGTTTTDIIPLANGCVVALGTTDTTRLLNDELVYMGVERTPVCGLVSHLPYRGKRCPVALEYFATTYDVYLLLEQLPENPLDMRTADNRPATKKQARLRMGRMIAADDQEFNHRDAIQMAEVIAAAQLRRIAQAAQRVIARLNPAPQTYILSGSGEFLAARVLEELPPAQKVVQLSRELGPMLSRCAPAHALAVLAREAHGL
jgi:probable H4MPT-linked C1 transfer pathway protein